MAPKNEIVDLFLTPLGMFSQSFKEIEPYVSKHPKVVQCAVARYATISRPWLVLRPVRTLVVRFASFRLAPRLSGFDLCV